jgi:type III secretion protein R
MNFTDSPALVLGLVIALALVPYLAVMVTAFAKLVIVFSLLRNALGLQQTPPNMVINGLAMILSVYVFYPVGLQMSDLAEKSMAGKPKMTELSQFVKVANDTKGPLIDFMVKHSTQAERDFFKRTAKKMLPPEKQDLIGDRDLMIVVPAFTVAELSAAFKIGFMIYLPFLVIDLVVSNILLGMGMMMLSPTTVSLPFKLLLFVMLEGWSKLIRGLVETYV